MASPTTIEIKKTDYPRAYEQLSQICTKHPQFKTAGGKDASCTSSVTSVKITGEWKHYDQPQFHIPAQFIKDELVSPQDTLANLKKLPFWGEFIFTTNSTSDHLMSLQDMKDMKGVDVLVTKVTPGIYFVELGFGDHGKPTQGPLL